MKYQRVNKDSNKSLTAPGNLADLSSGPVTQWPAGISVLGKGEKEVTGQSRGPKQCSLWKVARITEIHRFLRM